MIHTPPTVSGSMSREMKRVRAASFAGSLDNKANSSDLVLGQLELEEEDVFAMGVFGEEDILSFISKLLGSLRVNGPVCEYDLYTS